ncbi:NAD(+) synthase [Agathobaculum sp.]|uniref:NAD(+) synthase n=1 Tax=Agathobaculum sp. TaxID=2048138 RepID=UPI002A7F9921|nr:NAD(+) synthase [Agathobaculum sp.]MDY3618008.1 NAD(+) synthase [Agathobaculum sp.]
MKDGFIKVAAATPALRVADTAHNAAEIIKLAKEAAGRGASLVVFPELSLTGYTCGDLFLQETLLHGALHALETVLRETAQLDLLLIVGLPFSWEGKLYNVAAVLERGDVLGLVPKQHLPNYAEFYEQRHFTSGKGIDTDICLRLPGGHVVEGVPFGGVQVWRHADMPEFAVGVEICEDLWVPEPPSAALARAGATVIVNLSASDEVVGKAAYRRELVKSQSARLMCAYVYADAGCGESVQDMVFAGHDLIAENGALLAESDRFSGGVIYADLDLGRLLHDRRRMNTYASSPCRQMEFYLPERDCDLADRTFPRTPFVPGDRDRLQERCEEILAIQSTGLASRLRHTNAKTAVIGLSGGLDSTLALIVMVHAFDRLGLDRKGILAVTMPCFGTTARTKGNAEKLAEAYGATLKTVDIKAAVDQHFADIGQSKDDLTVTFENGQARMRTMVLMDLANMHGGLVVGTGDLSELALGWATYNGDHMSMYGVNASIPKTLVRDLVAFEAGRSEAALSAVLRDVLDTPVSPELLPPRDGEISQKTEDLVGPYELHDFFLYYMVRFGYPPRKIFRAAQKTFAGVYDGQTIKKWLGVFIRRFFSQQFKRSCLPDGPKVGSVSLSPRGDWRMPSDAAAALWLSQLETL